MWLIFTNRCLMIRKQKNGVINIVALEKIGKAYIDKTATETEIENAVKYVIEG